MDGKYYLVNKLKNLENFKKIIRDTIFKDNYENFFNINNDKFIEYLKIYKNNRSIDNSAIKCKPILKDFDYLDLPQNKENIYKINNYHKKFNSKENDIKELITTILTTKLNYNKLDNIQIQYIYLMLAPSNSITTGYITNEKENTIYFKLIDLFKFIYGQDTKQNEWLTKRTEFGIKISKNKNSLNFMFLNFNKKPPDYIQMGLSDNIEMGFIFPFVPVKDLELIKSIINATLFFEFIELTIDCIKDKDSTLFNLNNQKMYTVKDDVEIFNFIERGNDYNYLIDFDTNRNKGERKNMKKNVQLNLIKKPKNDKINKFICLANDYKDVKNKKKKPLYKNLYYHPNMNYSDNNYPKNKGEYDKAFDDFLKLKTVKNKLYSSYNILTKSLENIYTEEKHSEYIYYSKNKSDIRELMRASDIICLQEAKITDFNLQKVINSDDNEPIKIKVVIDNDIKKGLKSKNIKQFLRTNNIENLDKNFFINIYKSKKYTDNGIFSNKNLIYISNRLASQQNDDQYDDEDDDDIVKKNSIKKFNITLFSDKIKLKNNDIYIGKIGNGWDYTHIHTFTAIKLDNECIINIHLDTDDKKKIKQTELKILFNKIISRNKFFDKIKRIIVTGDLNMDAVDIIDILYSQIKSSFYINKKFRILFNNIITGNKTALDNCIIIEENNETNKCDDPEVIFEPNIYVTANKYNVHRHSITIENKIRNASKKRKGLLKVERSDINKEKEKLSDHSLISYYIDIDDSVQTLESKKEKEKYLKIKMSDSSNTIDNKSSRTKSISSSDEIDYKIIAHHKNILEIIKIYLINYNKFKEFIICLSRTTSISSLDDIDFSLEDNLNKLNLKLAKFKKKNKTDFEELENNILLLEKDIESIETLIINTQEAISDETNTQYDKENLEGMLDQFKNNKIDLEENLKKNKNEKEKKLNKLEEYRENKELILKKVLFQNSKIQNLKIGNTLDNLLKELIDDFRSSSNSNEENILKKIFLKCNIKLFIENKKYKDIDNELKLNDLCLIKKNIKSEITYFLYKLIKINVQ